MIKLSYHFNHFSIYIFSTVCQCGVHVFFSPNFILPFKFLVLHFWMHCLTFGAQCLKTIGKKMYKMSNTYLDWNNEQHTLTTKCIIISRSINKSRSNNSSKLRIINMRIDINNYPVLWSFNLSLEEGINMNWWFILANLLSANAF